MALTFQKNTTDELDVGTGLNSLSETCTWMGWINVTSYPQSDELFVRIASSRSGSEANRWEIQINHRAGGPAPDRILAWNRSYATTNAGLGSVSATIAFGTWQFFAIVDNGTGNTPQVYVGNLTTLAADVVNSATAPAGALGAQGSNSTHIGARPNGGTGTAFSGEVAWFGICDEALTLNQIHSIQFHPQNCMNFSCQLNIHPGLGAAAASTQPDWSGNSNNGTPTGLVIAPHVPLGLPFPQARQFLVPSAAAATVKPWWYYQQQHTYLAG